MRQLQSILFFSILVSFIACNESRQPADNFLEKEHWKKEAFENILPYWTLHARDTAKDAFYSNLDSSWNRKNDTIKFPSMIARHLFGYSVAYLLNGDAKYLSIANELKNYLLSKAWDSAYGGWFDALDVEGKALQTTKSTFVQVYVITGLTMYYFITHDAAVKEYIDKSNNLLEEKAWDHELGGYFDAPERDWSIKTETKSISSQLAPGSGYLLYLYMATRDKKYLGQAERITDTILHRMKDPLSGWVMESFDRNWKYKQGRQDQEEINIGHNIEIAWTLLRLHLLNGNGDYLRTGKALADSLHQYGFNSTSGFWTGGIGRLNPIQHAPYTYWWIQAYGNMFDLCLERLFPEKGYKANFSKGAAYWDKHILDKKKGDTYLGVMENGEVKNSMKANQFKASYHNMEHCMLNYLYLGCWVNAGPVTLYFNITSGRQGEILYPLPIEKLNSRITSVTIDGNDYKLPTENESYVTLPTLNNATIAVTIN